MTSIAKSHKTQKSKRRVTCDQNHAKITGTGVQAEHKDQDPKYNGKMFFPRTSTCNDQIYQAIRDLAKSFCARSVKIS